MVTLGSKMPEIARQLSANENPLQRGKCVRLVGRNWVKDFTNLYNSTDEFINRDYAIINKLGELYDYQTATEVKFFLDHVDVKVRQEYFDTFLKTSDLDEQSTVKIRSPSTVLESKESSATLEVRWIGSTDKKQPTSGRFRLFMKKNGNEHQVKFGRRPACILYLIYLLDIYESRNTATLDINNYNDQFYDLFYKVYAYGGDSQFKNMIGQGKSGQKLLRHCLSDIREAVGNTCKLLHEEVLPYILPDKDSHLCVEKRNIDFDKEIFNSKYGDPTRPYTYESAKKMQEV